MSIERAPKRLIDDSEIGELMRQAAEGTMTAERLSQSGQAISSAITAGGGLAASAGAGVSIAKVLLPVARRGSATHRYPLQR